MLSSNRTWAVVWDPQALAKVTRFLGDDPEGLAQLVETVDLLVADPRPPGSVPYGSDDLRRMHAGRYRTLYEVSEDEKTIMVIHVGRIG